LAPSPPTRRGQASILDRLVDPGTWEVLARDPGLGMQGGSGLQGDLRAAVERDLENLLNTRRPPVGWPEELAEELDRSLLAYGLQDLSTVNFVSDDSREEFRQIVENSVRQFEPRFRTVTVVLRQDAEGMDRTLRLGIEGLLHAEPVPLTVAFDSILEPVACGIDVEARNR
jgi:type VI secretion system protein ImpF